MIRKKLTKTQGHHTHTKRSLYEQDKDSLRLVKLRDKKKFKP